MIVECLLLTASACQWANAGALRPLPRTNEVRMVSSYPQRLESPPIAKLRVPRFSRPVLLASLALAAVQLSDGASTRSAQRDCPRCYESDPLARALLGRHPGWGRMVPLGVGENLAATLLAERLHRSKHRALRALWPVPQGALFALHLYATVHNARQ